MGLLGLEPNVLKTVPVFFPCSEKKNVYICIKTKCFHPCVALCFDGADISYCMCLLLIVATGYGKPREHNNCESERVICTMLKFFFKVFSKGFFLCQMLYHRKLIDCPDIFSECCCYYAH